MATIRECTPPGVGIAAVVTAGRNVDRHLATIGAPGWFTLLSLPLPARCSPLAHKPFRLPMLDAGVGGVDRRLMLRVADRETRPLDHRCEQPAEGAVLLAQVRFQ